MIASLQKEVDSLRNTLYPHEEKEDLSFYVHTLIGCSTSSKKEPDKILLTINHHGYILSRAIFPKLSHFDYICIEEEMKHLYGATMWGFGRHLKKGGLNMEKIIDRFIHLVLMLIVFYLIDVNYLDAYSMIRFITIYFAISLFTSIISYYFRKE